MSMDSALRVFLVTAFSIMLAARDAGSPTRPTPELALSASLPAETIAYLELDLDPLFSRGQDLAIAKILAEPSVRQFLAPLLKLATEGRQEALAEFSREVGLPLADVAILLRTRISVAFVGLFDPVDTTGAPLRAAHPLPDLVLTLDAGSAMPAAEKVLARYEELLASGGALSKGSIAGKEIRRFTANDGDLPEVLVYAGNGRVVIGTNPKTFEQVVLGKTPEAGSLAASPRFAGVVAEARRSGELLFFYGDVATALRRFGPMAGEEVMELAKKTGFESLEAVAYGLSLDGPNFRDRFYLHVPNPAGIFTLFTGFQAPLAIRKLVPDHAVIASTARIGWSRVVVWLTSDTMGDEAASIKHFLTEFKQRIGLDLQDDILESLGSEVAFYASLPGQALVPDLVALVETVDRAKVEKSLAAFLDQSGLPPRRNVQGPSGPITVVPLAPAGTPVPALAYTWVDRYLAVSLWPNALRNLQADLGKKPSLDASPEFAAALARLTAERPNASKDGYEFLDLRRAVGFILDNAIPLLQLVSNAAAELPVDLAELPPTRSITGHLTPLLASREATAKGFLLEMTSPVGGLPLIGALAGVTSALFVARIRLADQTQFEVDRAAMQTYSLVSRINEAIGTFTRVEGRLPADTEWPTFLVRGSPNHPEPYLTEDYEFFEGQLLDGWGTPIRYELLPDDQYRIVSLGADKAEGGEGSNEDIIGFGSK